MKTRLAHLVALLGLATTMLLGVTGAAHATTDPEFECANLVGAVVCDNTVNFPIDLKVTVSGARVLSAAELDLLDEELDAAVGGGPGCNDIQILVIQIYDDHFSVEILSNNIIVIPCTL